MTTDLQDAHPKPWRVVYHQRFPEWSPKALPYVVDANDQTVVELPSRLGHPGLYDAEADQTAHQIVNAVNQYGLKEES